MSRPTRLATHLPRPWAAALALLALAGCAGERGYPSLARLPAERIALAVPPAPPAPVAPEPLPTETGARAQRLAADVAAAHDRFTLLVARIGMAPRRDIALAELAVARGQTSFAAAELDRLYAEDRVSHAEADGIAGSAAAPRPAATLLARLRDSALATLAAEDATLASVEAKTP